MLDYGKPRVVPLDAFFERRDRDKRPAIPFGLSVDDLYQDLFDREFKFVRRQNQQVVLFEKGSTFDAFIEATFGAFPEEGFLSPLAKSYSQAFDPAHLTPTADNWIKVFREGYPTPLTFTKRGIKREPDGYRNDLTLFILNPNSPLDVIDLWNLRQFTPYVVPVNMEWINDTRAYLAEVITANYRPLPGNRYGVMLRTTVQLARSLCNEGAKETIISLCKDVPQGSWSLQPWYEGIWHVDRAEEWPLRLRRSRITAEQTDLQLSLSGDSTQQSIQFVNLSPKFASRFGDGEARWANVLRLNSYATEESIALVLPLDFIQTNFPRLRLTEGALISREGIVLLERYTNHQEFLAFPSGADAIIEWLKAHGVDAKGSRGGNVANQVLSSMGGVWRTSLLADRETLEQLDNMAKSVKKYADGKVEEYPDRTKPVHVWQSLIKRRNSQRQFASLSPDAFIKAGILRLGLSVDCPKCTNQNWYSLKAVDDQVVCERCLKPFDFPQGNLDFGKTWHYRVVGPFSVPDFAQGAYATVLALRAFSQQLAR